MQKPFLTIADTAELLNVAESTIRKMIKSGELPAVQIGSRGLWRISPESIDEYIAESYKKTRASVLEKESTS